MECTDVGLRAASGTGLPVETSPPAPSPASGVLCMRCEIRARCLGGVAAEAGTAQLQGVLAGRVALLRSEVLYGPGEALRHVYVVRKGTLRSSVRRADGVHVSGFHFPGELVGVDGLTDGRQRATVVALESAELCALRFAPRPDAPAGVRAFFARLWDIMSCEMLRERAHQSLLATLPPAQRVLAFLASAAARAKSRRAILPLTAQDVASYLRLPTAPVIPAKAPSVIPAGAPSGPSRGATPRHSREGTPRHSREGGNPGLP